MNRRTALLAAARTAAWALLFGGWLVLGALALRHGPGGALLLAPLALWLASVALAQRALAHHAPTPWALRALLLAAGGAAAAGVAQGGWLLAAPAWGLLLVLASAVVRRRRLALAGDVPPSPRGPALLAALVAAAVAGDPLAGAPLAALPALLAVLALGAGFMAWPGPPAAALAAVATLLGLAAAWAGLTAWRAGRRVPRFG